jgi:N-acetylneuraminate synthase
MKIDQVFRRNAASAAIELPYIIAEAGVNHEGSMDIARRLVAEAAAAGADAIKFQTYKADTLASRHSPSYWDLSKEPTRSQHELFKKYDKFWKKEFEELKRVCEREGIEFLSTPFDEESARFLNELMSAYKVSSSDLTNRPFIELICSFGKPVILSTGASELHEIQEAVSWIRGAGNVPLALLHCVLNYPTADKDAQLGMILGLRRAFPDLVIGYSDHTLPKDMTSLEIATLFGAAILEKHFTHDKTLPGNDHYHAMDKDDLAHFRRRLDGIFERIGGFEVRALAEERAARLNARRSLVARRPIRKGAAIAPDDLTWKRPATGISPKHYPDVLQRTALRDIDEDTVLQWNMLG